MLPVGHAHSAKGFACRGKATLGGMWQLCFLEEDTEVWGGWVTHLRPDTSTAGQNRD